jgi:hypothetical protein
MFEVRRHKHVSMTVAGYLHYKVWIVEARSHSNAQTLLLETVCPTQSTRGHLKKEHRLDTDQKDTLNSEQIRSDWEADQKGPANQEGAPRKNATEDT